jgi:hypothetical protein
MGRILVMVGALFGASLIATAGALLVFRADLFLRFYDFLNPGMKWNKTAEWRQNVARQEYKTFGLLLLSFGLFILFITFVRLLEAISNGSPR